MATQTAHALRLGLDYALTPEQTLTLAVQPRFNRQDNQESLDSRQVNATAFYRLETNTAQGFRRVLTDLLTGDVVTSTTRQNLGQETSVGLELVGATPVTSFWKLNGTASAFRRLIRGASLDGTPIHTASQAYATRLNNTFSPTRKLDLQLAPKYRSPINTSQGQRRQNVNVDVAAKHTVLGNRGSLTLRVADVFNTLRYDFTLTGPGLLTDSRFKRELRMAFLGFAYRFGQNQTSRSPRKSETDEAIGGFE
ncbi:outer membrane beta-barrel protein [Hymenobacter lucidus]|uniref:Outer membrane beta-barrel family protein n=1 Tax=Hymenobacter lucidus TaxID=2880930 RepID=A0ABS8AY12_9BACT|nr:outer membrane beta-barrel family protein [Hymenobacter lucidus]